MTLNFNFLYNFIRQRNQQQLQAQKHRQSWPTGEKLDCNKVQKYNGTR